MKSPICLALNGVANIILYSMSAFIVSDRWSFVLLYIALPITILLFIFHLVGFFLPARSIAPSIFCGLLLGFLDPLRILYAYQTYGDVTAMAVPFLFWAYGVFAVAGFVLCAIVLGVRNLFVRRHGEHRVQH